MNRRTAIKFICAGVPLLACVRDPPSAGIARRRGRRDMLRVALRNPFRGGCRE